MTSQMSPYEDYPSEEPPLNHFSVALILLSIVVAPLFALVGGVYCLCIGLVATARRQVQR